MAKITDPIDWTKIEDAIYAWFQEQADMPVVWEHQDSPQPNRYPFGTIHILQGLNHPANQWVDQVRYSEESGQPPGEEINVQVGGLRELTVSCRILSKPGDPSPDLVMSRAQLSLTFPTIRQALWEAGLSVIIRGSIEDASVQVEDTWIQSAVMDVVFGLLVDSSERTGYIATVETNYELEIVPGTEISGSEIFDVT